MAKRHGKEEGAGECVPPSFSSRLKEEGTVRAADVILALFVMRPPRRYGGRVRPKAIQLPHLIISPP